MGVCWPFEQTKKTYLWQEIRFNSFVSESVDQNAWRFLGQHRAHNLSLQKESHKLENEQDVSFRSSKEVLCRCTGPCNYDTGQLYAGRELTRLSNKEPNLLCFLDITTPFITNLVQ